MIELRMAAGHAAAEALLPIKLMATRFPGEHVLSIAVATSGCARCGGGRRVVSTTVESAFVRAAVEEITGRPACECPGAWTPDVRRLRLGPEWRYDASPACLAALSEFGEATLHTE